MSTSKKDRLKYLAARLESLSREIHEALREQEYLTLARSLAAGHIEPRIIDEDTWNLLLPAERQANLLFLYHTLRTEGRSQSPKI